MLPTFPPADSIHFPSALRQTTPLHAATSFLIKNRRRFKFPNSEKIKIKRGGNNVRFIDAGEARLPMYTWRFEL